MDPFVSSTAYSGQDNESHIDTAVPASMTLAVCRAIFKSLCSKASIFCKGFKVIESLANTYYVIVILTQALLDKGSVPAFCSTMAKLRKHVIFVTCSCDDD